MLWVLQKSKIQLKLRYKLEKQQSEGDTVTKPSVAALRRVQFLINQFFVACSMGPGKGDE